jgi:hypothetical protein
MKHIDLTKPYLVIGTKLTGEEDEKYLFKVFPFHPSDVLAGFDSLDEAEKYAAEHTTDEFFCCVRHNDGFEFEE